MTLVCRLLRRHWWVYYGHDLSACRCLVCKAWRPDCRPVLAAPEATP